MYKGCLTQGQGVLNTKPKIPKIPFVLSWSVAGAQKDSKTPEYVCVCPGKTGLSSMKLV